MNEEERIRRRIDIIYDVFDERFQNGEFSLVDEFLRSMDTDRLNIQELLAYLTASLPAKSRLSHYKGFYESAKTTLEKRGEMEEGLLDGLEPS